MLKTIFIGVFSLIFSISNTTVVLAQENNGNGGQQEDTITICHANNGVNGFSVLEVDPSSLDGEGQNDHSLHEGDIIPISDENQDGEITVEDCQIAAGWVDEDGEDEDGETPIEEEEEEEEQVEEEEEIVCTEENGPLLSIGNSIIKVYSGTTFGLLDFLTEFSYEVSDPDGGDVVVDHDAHDLFPLPGFGTYLVSVIATDDEGCSRNAEISIIYEDDGDTSNEEDPTDEQNPTDEDGENEEDATPVEEEETSDNGGGSSSGSRRTSGGQTLGEVLGATTADTCPEFTTFHKKGDQGGEVSKIQEFLNTHNNAGLVVDGMFGPQTEKAVHAFQQKYWEQTIKPWTPELSTRTTGRWYKTTKAWANELVECREDAQILEDTGRWFSTADFFKISE